ncbi:MAG: polysaccharide deacetylase family protein [Bacteroidales bacterium]|nr:polysaccharide deacetylase family protein [Clostridium sp.]MCM1203799.1 polysaccharide deacetylase family protein [Bacteroidales bacterium]
MKLQNKIIIGVAVIAVLAGLGLAWRHFRQQKGNSGFIQNGKAGMETEEKTDAGSTDSQEGENGQDKPEKRKRIIVEHTDYSAIDNKLYAWWFKRNDNHEKSGCQEDFDITEYDAYYTVPVNGKKMYITFDCGYENGYTADILDTLKEEQVTAAFFVTQTYIRDNVELTKRMKEEGHLVCNHTVTHPSMPSKTVEEQKQELLTCESYMKEATGYEMDLFFRPPKGEYSRRTLQMAKDLGYSTIFWSMAYLDYDVNNQPTSAHVEEHFAKYYHPGAIPLMHNVSVANKDALKQVIRQLKQEGYSFGSLYDLKD